MNNFLNFSLKNTYVIIEKSTLLHNAITCSVLVENVLIPFFSQFFFEIIKWCKNKQLKFMLQDLQIIRKHNLAVVVNDFFEGTNWEMFDLIFLNYLIWVLTNTFRFSCVLYYSCWKISHFLFFFLSFLFRMILLVFLMWLFVKNDFLVQFCCMHLWWVFFFFSW